MNNPKLECELCRETIGVVLLEKLKYPIDGTMFDTHMPEFGVKKPFDDSLTWADMRCPYGKTHRPFITEDAIFTDYMEGWFIEKDGKFVYTPNSSLPDTFWEIHNTKREIREILDNLSEKKRRGRPKKETVDSTRVKFKLSAKDRKKVREELAEYRKRKQNK